MFNGLFGPIKETTWQKEKRGGQRGCPGDELIKEGCDGKLINHPNKQLTLIN